MNRHAIGKCLVVASTVLLAACGAQAASMTLKLPAASGSAGADVKVPVDIQGAQGCGAVQFDLTYDPSVLEVKSVDEGALLSGAMLTSNVAKPGSLKVAGVTQGPLSGDGTVAVVTFRVKGSGESPLGLENVRAWEHANNLEMLVSIVPGQFTATGQSMMLWVILGVAVLLALILVVIVLKMKRPKSQVG